MTAGTNRILRVVAGSLMLVSTGDPDLTNRQKLYINITVAAMYEFLGVKAQKSNPDGTPAECAWHPPSKTGRSANAG